MPRVQMTPMRKLALYALGIYLAAMLVLIVVKFIQKLKGA